MIKQIGKKFASRWPWPVLATLKPGQKMYVDLRSGIGRGIYVKGEFDPVVFEPIKAALFAGGTFVDVGANVGYYSVLALNEVGPTGHVHAFEIDPRPLRCLQKTVHRFGLANLHLHKTAVSSKKGYGFLTKEDDCGHSHVESVGNGIQVSTTSIDLWLEEHPCESIDAIKIDVEGSESEVLAGALETLKKHRPLLVFEADANLLTRHESDVRSINQFLERIGYRMHNLDKCWAPTIVATPNS